MLKSLFFLKLQAWPATLLNLTLLHSFLSVDFAEFLRTPILKNICQRLLLTPLEKTLVIKTKLLDLLLMLVVALAN